MYNQGMRARWPLVVLLGLLVAARQRELRL
jgi:hypothetical protein